MNSYHGELSTAALIAVVEQESRKSRAHHAIRGFTLGLILCCTGALLCASLVLPIFRIHGTSMSPTLRQGDLAVSISTKSPKRGDIIAFYYNNKVFIKRVIALPGEQVELLDDGTVVIDGTALSEPYLAGKAKGSTNLTYPCTVPEGAVFVMGDEREGSIDSRRSEIGFVETEQIAGRIVFTLPFWRDQ